MDLQQVKIIVKNKVLKHQHLEIHHGVSSKVTDMGK